MDLGIASFAAIVIICYLLGIAIKTSNIDDKWIPLSVGILGMLLGICAYWLNIPDFPAHDILNAAAVGIISGLSSTGINQLFKQFQKANSISSEQNQNESGD